MSVPENLYCGTAPPSEVQVSVMLGLFAAEGGVVALVAVAVGVVVLGVDVTAVPVVEALPILTWI